MEGQSQIDACAQGSSLLTRPTLDHLCIPAQLSSRSERTWDWAQSLSSTKGGQCRDNRPPFASASSRRSCPLRFSLGHKITATVSYWRPASPSRGAAPTASGPLQRHGCSHHRHHPHCRADCERRPCWAGRHKTATSASQKDGALETGSQGGTLAPHSLLDHRGA